MSYWPKKNHGIWDFSLAGLRLAKSKKRTLSMDYNMYVAQSGAKPIGEYRKDFEDEVFETYLNYFYYNYRKNRAPIDIGHHFSLWNHGIYWRAMKRFARAVCHLPEVICGTYSDQAKFLDSKTPEVLAAYQKGAFPKMESRHSLDSFGNESNLNLASSIAPVRELSDKDLFELNQTVCPAEAHREEAL